MPRKSPEKRYETAEKLAQELDAFLEGRPIEARPRSRAIRAWHWMEGVPLVGALTGRSVLHSSDLHRRFQAAMLLMMLLSPIIAVGIFTAWSRHKQSMPDPVLIGGGVEDGVYKDLSQELQQRVAAAHPVKALTVSSRGSIDNREHLRNYRVHIAPMQLTAVTGERLFLVAPLFHELLYVLARSDSDIESIEDLRGKRVALGPKGSGSWETSDLVFDSLNLGDSITSLEIDWEDLQTPDPSNAPDAAMLWFGRGSDLVTNLISGGHWRLIPIPISAAMKIANEHSGALDPVIIEPSEFPGGQVATETATVSTTAFLVAREDTPSDLVTAVLEALYQNPPPCHGLLPRSQARDWRTAAFHKAARKFYELE